VLILTDNLGYGELGVYGSGILRVAQHLNKRVANKELFYGS